jgi:hypothetical protein
MKDENDPDGTSPHILGVKGTSKVVMDSAIDGTVAFLSLAIPAGSPVFAAGAATLKGVGTMLQEHQDRNVTLMLKEATAEAGMSLDDFVEVVKSAPERLLPFVAACDAARRTVLDDKVRALGRALGDLTRDDSLIDDSGVWISIFSQVEAAHVRIVLAMCEEDPEYRGEGRTRLWKRGELRDRFNLSGTITTLLNTLVSLGLVREVRAEDLSSEERARWGVRGPAKDRIPLYGKGSLTNEFLAKLGTSQEKT